MSLLNEIVTPLLHQQHKHELGENWTIDYINKLTNMELLELISNTLDAMQEKEDAQT